MHFFKFQSIYFIKNYHCTMYTRYHFYLINHSIHLVKIVDSAARQIGDARAVLSPLEKVTLLPHFNWTCVEVAPIIWSQF